MAATMVLARAFTAAAISTASKAANSSKKSEVAVKKRVSGLKKLLPLSPSLRTFLGVPDPDASRGLSMKKIWQYIKKNNLQKPKTLIMSDKKLHNLFA